MKKPFFRKDQIPNYLTIFRILLVPVIIVLMLVKFGPVIYHFHIFTHSNAPEVIFNLNLLLSVIFFTIACLTDALDGYLARKFHWISNFGKFWDPLADKILTNSVMFCLASPQLNIVPIWVPIVLLIRDIIIDGTRMMSAKQNIVVPSNWFGKVKTINIMIAIIIAYFVGFNYDALTIGNNYLGNVYYWVVQNILMFTSLGLSVLSGCIYYAKFVKIQRKKREEKTI